MNSALRRSTTLTGANLVAMVCMFGIVSALPAIAGVVRVLRDRTLERGDIVRTLLSHVRRTVGRDWPLSLALVACVMVGAVTLASVLGWFAGGTKWGLLGLTLLVYCTLGLLLAGYAQASGTLPPDAPRRDVMELAMRRIMASPGRSLLAVLVLVCCLPLWLLAPLAVVCGITLPVWLHNRLWRPFDQQMLEFEVVEV